jgi:hypothetical protein
MEKTNAHVLDNPTSPHADDHMSGWGHLAVNGDLWKGYETLEGLTLLDV